MAVFKNGSWQERASWFDLFTADDTHLFWIFRRRRMSGYWELFLHFFLYFFLLYFLSVLIRISYLLLSRDPKNLCLWPANKKQSSRTLIVMGSGNVILFFERNMTFPIHLVYRRAHCWNDTATKEFRFQKVLPETIRRCPNRSHQRFPD